MTLRKKTKQVTCYCDAYAFAHRKFSGKCEGVKQVETSGETRNERMLRETGMSQKYFS